MRIQRCSKRYWIHLDGRCDGLRERIPGELLHYAGYKTECKRVPPKRERKLFSLAPNKKNSPLRTVFIIR